MLFHCLEKLCLSASPRRPVEEGLSRCGCFGPGFCSPGTLRWRQEEAENCRSRDTREVEGWTWVLQGSEDMNSQGEGQGIKQQHLGENKSEFIMEVSPSAEVAAGSIDQEGNGGRTPSWMRGRRFSRNLRAGPLRVRGSCSGLGKPGPTASPAQS